MYLRNNTNTLSNKSQVREKFHGFRILMNHEFKVFPMKAFFSAFHTDEAKIAKVFPAFG